MNPLANDSNSQKIPASFALNVRKNPNSLFNPVC
jgi:hypothetical protein